VVCCERELSAHQATIVALVGDAALRDMLSRALCDRTQLLFATRGGELLQRIQQEQVAVALVSVRDAMGVHTAPTVVRVRARFPRLPVIGICALEQTTGSDVLLLAKAGVKEILLRGRDDIRSAVQRVLRVASGEHATSAVLAALSRELAQDVIVIVRPCLEHARHNLTVSQLARLVGVHRRTLHNRLRRAGAPTPRAIIGWCRILLAAYQLEERGQSVENVAFSLGFSSAPALWNMMHRYTGCGPQRIRARGGLDYVLAQFRTAICRRG
jgi:AraC-like DNA-binding protein